MVADEELRLWSFLCSRRFVELAVLNFPWRHRILAESNTKMVGARTQCVVVTAKSDSYYHVVKLSTPRQPHPFEDVGDALVAAPLVASPNEITWTFPELPSEPTAVVRRPPRVSRIGSWGQVVRLFVHTRQMTCGPSESLGPEKTQRRAFHLETVPSETLLPHFLQAATKYPSEHGTQVTTTEPQQRKFWDLTLLTFVVP